MTKVDPHRLNAISPYFTMFPLEFPLSVLREHATPGDWVLDPYCGRGTTNFASRVVGLPTIGIDSSPVAVATAQAKLLHVAPITIVRMASRILKEVSEPSQVPKGIFWERAYNPSVLYDLCRLREGLVRYCTSDARIALRAVLLGALHGPLKKSGTSSYLSNQCPRTYAPKPAYAVNFWARNGMTPPKVKILDIISERAERYYGAGLETGRGRIILGDSRHSHPIERLTKGRGIKWVITSPPYYGMRTYIPDQWLRNWLVGGTSEVDYSMEGQLSHRSPDIFASQMREVWRNVGVSCQSKARLVIRFGGISKRQTCPQTILKNSLENSGWTIDHVQAAGSAANGHRQADSFLRTKNGAVEEHDVWATWQGIN